MAKLLLSLHVVAAVVLVGPMTVAVGAFPRCARSAAEPSGAALAGVLHHATRAFTVLAPSVPVLGIALAGRMGVLGDAWVLGSLALTVVAAVLLAAVVLPEQHRVMGALAAGVVGPRAGSLRAAAPALFALVWVAVVVLMVVRPGSTTGV